MAGHSKWKQIKHYKAATDAKRGAQFAHRPLDLGAHGDAGRECQGGTTLGVDFIDHLLGAGQSATLPIPASLQARMTRTAISPRLAISTFCSGLTWAT